MTSPRPLRSRTAGRRVPATLPVACLLALVVVGLLRVVPAGAADPPDAAPVDPAVVAEVEDTGTAMVVADLTPPSAAASLEQQADAVRNEAGRVLAALPDGSFTGAPHDQAAPFVALRVDAKGLAALAHQPEVTRVTLNRVNEVDLTISVPSIDADTLRGAGTTGAGQAVAIVDTGVQRDHPFLLDGSSNSRVVREACFSALGGAFPGYLKSTCPGGAVSATGTGSAAPCNLALNSLCGHGTHVAGIAAGSAPTNAGTLTRPQYGVAPAAAVLAVQASTFICSGGIQPGDSCPAGWRLGLYDSDIALALDWVDQQRNDFAIAAVNLSLGTDVNRSTACDATAVATPYIDQLRGHGITTVAASGNEYHKNGISSPACISTVVSVGAWDDLTNQVAAFSNSAPILTLLAPGSSTASGVQRGIWSSWPTSTWAGYAGTSMAAPHVTGALALLRQQGPSRSPEEMTRILQGTGTRITDVNGVTTSVVRLNGIDGPFTPISPVRALDTRTAGPCVGGAPRLLALAGQFGVPANAAAVALNVTAVNPWGDGYLTVYPTGSTYAPLASNLNFVAGQTVPNMVTVRLGPDGAIALYANNGCPEVVVDVAGWFSGPPVVGGGFTGISPTRALDTRLGGGCVSGVRTLALAGQFGVPADASAVALNVTVVGPYGPGYLTVYPSGGGGPPEVSNLNFVAGQTVPNMVDVRLGADGAVKIFANYGCPDVVVDVTGWFEATPSGPGGFVGLTPFRALDTRTSGPCVSGPRTLVLAGLPGIPVGAAAVALNVTVVGPSVAGYLTVYPSGGGGPPLVSNLNFVAGQTVPNMVTVRLGPDGAIKLYASAGCPNVIVDVAGWYAATT